MENADGGTACANTASATQVGLVTRTNKPGKDGPTCNLMNHLETKEFILYALEAAVSNAVEKSCLARYPEEKQKHLNDMKSLLRCIEIISSLSEADILCAPVMEDP